MTHDSTQNPARRVVVVGGGVIGLSIAWRLARRGMPVTVVDRERVGQAASRVAAGMLAPVSEAGFEDAVFVDFGRRSLHRYPSFLTELEADAGTAVPIDTRGTLVVAMDTDDAAYIRRAHDYRVSAGMPVAWLTGAEARDVEPVLSPRVSAAMSIPGDHHLDVRVLVPALAAACRARGVTVIENAHVCVQVNDERVRGVEADGQPLEADTVVIAAGAWSGSIAGVPSDCAPPVRPVKGQILRLRRTPGFTLAHIVRTPRAYLVPKPDGTLVVGATQEEMGFDLRPTAGAVKDILAHAWDAVPAIYELPIESVDVGLRPGSRDGRPVIGDTRVHGLMVASGHFRHGILLAPVTADAVCERVVHGRFDDALAPFAPARFSPVAS